MTTKIPEQGCRPKRKMRTIFSPLLHSKRIQFEVTLSKRSQTIELNLRDIITTPLPYYCLPREGKGGKKQLQM